MQQLELFAIAALNLITGKCKSTQFVSCRQDMLALQITRKNSGRGTGDCHGGGRRCLRADIVREVTNQ